MDDCVSAAYLGMCEAALRFDPSKGFKFITYAVWHIKRFHINLVTENRVVRLPSSATFEGDYTMRGSGKNKVVVRFRRLNLDRRLGSSTNRGGGDSQTQKLEDLLIDPAPLPDVVHIQGEISNILHDILFEKFEYDRRALILVERFWNDAILAQVGAILRLTRERVRQIEQKTLREVRGLVFRKEIALKSDDVVYFDRPYTEVLSGYRTV